MKTLPLAIRVKRLIRGRNPKARKRRPVYRMPRMIEQDYYTRLVAPIRRYKALVDTILLPMLESLANEARGDSTHTDGYVDAVQALVNLLQREFEKAKPTDPALVAMLQELAARTDRYNSAETTRVVKGIIDIEVVGSVPALSDKIAAFTRQNVELIKSIPVDYLYDVEQTVTRGFRAGERADRIAERLNERYDVTENRAKLIARDQVGKFYGELTKARQTNLGITRYIWRSSRDERVRPLHEERDGQPFEWANPPDETPDDGHPGTPIQCRCTADPMIEDLLEGLPEPEQD